MKRLLLVSWLVAFLGLTSQAGWAQVHDLGHDGKRDCGLVYVHAAPRA